MNLKVMEIENNEEMHVYVFDAIYHMQELILPVR